MNLFTYFPNVSDVLVDFSKVQFVEDIVCFSLLLICFCMILLGEYFISDDKFYDRFMFFIFCVFISIYLFWRFIFTMPIFGLSFPSLYSWFFLFLEVFWFIYLIGSHAIACDPLRCNGKRKKERKSDDLNCVENKLLELGYPAVDIFIPTYDEDLNVLEKTLVSALAIDYPNFKIWVLDDGNRKFLRDYCHAKNIYYISREKRINAKAGNINNALGQTSAAFILILDADFAPYKNIIKKGLLSFLDKQVAVVQIPQFYYNFDYIQNNLFAKKVIPDEQRYWYDVNQPYYDNKDLSMYCGCPAILRRVALEKTQGFPTDTVTEDLHLNYCLQEIGYITRYLNEPLAIGLNAEDVSSFCRQHYRWALGAIQVLRSRISPFGINKLTLKKRIRLFFTVIYWFVQPCRFLLLFPPVIFSFTGVPLLYVNSITGLYTILFVIFLNYYFSLKSHKLVPIVGESLQLIPAMAVTKGILRGFFPILIGAKPKFDVTPKDLRIRSLQWNFSIIFPYCVLFILSVASLFYYIYFAPCYNSLFGKFNIFWNIYVILALFVTILTGIDVPRSYDTDTWFVDEEVKIVDEDKTLVCKVEALSLTKAIVDIAIISKVMKSNCQMKLLLGDNLVLDIASVITYKNKSELSFSEIDEETREALIRYLFSDGRIKPTRYVNFSKLGSVFYYKVFKSWFKLFDRTRDLEIAN